MGAVPEVSGAFFRSATTPLTSPIEPTPVDVRSEPPREKTRCLAWEAELPSGRLRLLNPDAARAWGAEVGDLVSLTDWLDPRKRASLFRSCALVARDGRTREIEHEALTAEGDRLYLRTEIQRIPSSLTAQVRLLGTTIDVGDYRQNQARLEVAQRHLSVVLKKAPLVVFTLDFSGKITFAEGRELEPLGFKEPPVGMYLSDFAAEAPWMQDVLEPVIAGGEAIRSGWFRGRFLEVHCAPLVIAGATVAVIGMLNDASDRRRIEDELKLVMEQAAEGITVVAPNGRRLYVNPAAAELMGFADPAEAMRSEVGKLGSRAVPIDPSEPIATVPSLALFDGSDFAVAHLHYRLAPSGEPRFVRVRASAVRDEHGDLRFAVSMWTDLTAIKKAQDELQFQKTLLEAQSEASREGVVVVDAEGRIISRNRRFGEMWAVPDSVLETRSYREVVAFTGGRVKHPDAFYARVESLHTHPEAQGTDELELLDGRTILRHTQPLTAIEGRQLGRVWFFRDVSHEKEAERRERMFLLEHTARSLAEASSRRAAFLADASSLLASSLDHHDTLSRVLRLAVPYLADWSFIDLLESDGAVHRRVIAHSEPLLEEELRQLQEVKVDLHARAGIGHVIRSGQAELRAQVAPEELTLQPGGWSPAGVTTEAHLDRVRRLGMRSILTVPLIARKRTLGALTLVLSRASRDFGDVDLETANDLASRMAMAMDNANLYQESQASVQTRDEFLSIAAHELRTPLSALDLALRSLQLVGRRAGFGGYEKQARDALAAAERQSRRLEKLVESLLDVARIHSDNQPITIETVDLAELVRSVVEGFSEELARARCTVSVDASDGVVGRWDYALVEQVISNLVSNACKYGSGQPIEIRVGKHEGAARLDVRDHGIGIAPEMQRRIFDRFTRAVSPQHYGGLGLGLYIVKRAVETLGGEVEVVSEMGEGANFRVTLPLEAAPPERTDQEEEARWNGTR
jgi:PAS domain S-box-containing protein